MRGNRIDQVLVERGLAESRHKAQALVLAGQVLVDEQKVDKPGRRIDEGSNIRILEELPFVSRAGRKLQAALDHFQLSVSGRVCADLGAGTGGFADCLLQRGAREVHAFDVGRGQIAWKLRTDPRIVVRDEFNVRNLGARDFPEEISLVTADLSFISLTKILYPLREALQAKRAEGPVDLILLVKPQFEAGRGEVGKGGVVRDADTRQKALEYVMEHARGNDYQVVGSIPSPVTGSKGNQEFLLYLQLPTDL